jgi:hypothetical protein
MVDRPCSRPEERSTSHAAFGSHPLCRGPPLAVLPFSAACFVSPSLATSFVASPPALLLRVFCAPAAAPGLFLLACCCFFCCSCYYCLPASLLARSLPPSLPPCPGSTLASSLPPHGHTCQTITPPGFFPQV